MKPFNLFGPISKAQPILSNRIIKEYEVRQENKSIGMVSFIILAIMFSILIPFHTKQEPEEVRKCRPIVHISIPLPIPNVEYCFMCSENRVKAKSVMDKVTDIQDRIDTLEFPTVDMVLTSLGTYYITGYTSIECGGSTMTASGATVHKTDSSITNPTTCAIDPALHDFGDIFYLEEFGYYVAEDTGSAVKGKHLDLYFYDSEYNYALSITGKYEVFAVEYVYGTELASKYSIKELVASESIGSFFA